MLTEQGHELVERDQERDEVHERERPLEQPARVPVAGRPLPRHLGGNGRLGYHAILVITLDRS